ncbi:flagellar hook-associated family protein [Aureimonas ureilytica]|uniref:flagellar hook-associated family protein n=1 Tax=Aureimonas ureilytica TaxID=401562 RepID=UPI0003759B72|nr:flagellar hook-associated family protein [Aureimonas ureilytica]
MAISSLTLSNFSRSTIQRVQTQLADAQKELNTGRHADVGMTLGYVTGSAVTYHTQESSLKSMLETNKLTNNRFSLMANALGAVRDGADDYSKALLNGSATGTGVSALMTSATQGLQQIFGAINTTDGRAYVFSGTHSDTAPVKSDTTALTDDIKAKFLSALGISDVSQATADQVTAYFGDDGYAIPPSTTKHSFKNDFETSWQTVASAAGGVSTVNISKSEAIETSVSANQAAFKNSVAAYAMVSALGVDKMGDDARKQLTMAAQSKLKAGQDGIVKLQADIGVRQNRITAANDILTKQIDLVGDAYGRLEDVDSTEASLQVNQLMTQLNVSFAVTGKLQGLSILNYL